MPLPSAAECDGNVGCLVTLMFQWLYQLLNAFVLLLYPFGIGGNCLNLVVLLSREFRSGTNLLLAAVAFADLSYLICWLPFAIFQYEFLEPSLTPVINVYTPYRHNLLAFCNWFSAASIWLASIHIFFYRISLSILLTYISGK